MTSPRNSLFTELQRRQVSRVTTMAASTSRPLEYLESLPGMTFNKLYQQPSTALAIFRRMLPDLGISRSSPLVNRSFETDSENSKMLCHGTFISERSFADTGS
jgi:hypothetical protein